MLGLRIACRGGIVHWTEYGVLVNMVYGTSPKKRYIFIYIEVLFEVNNSYHVIAHSLKYQIEDSR